MRTTIRIDDELYRAVKARAAREGRTVGEVIEDALRVHTSTRRVAAPAPAPLPVYGGTGVLPGVDLGDPGGLRDLMDRDRTLDAMR